MVGKQAADRSRSSRSPAGGSGNRAQSEVIGVILMTAIAVVLAAVIGQFIFGINIIQSPDQSVGPQISFDTTVEGSNDDLTIRHQSGDRVDTDKISIVGSDGFSKSTFSSIDGGEWTASESITLDGTNLNSGETIRIIWESSTTDDSAVLLEYEYDP